MKIIAKYDAHCAARNGNGDLLDGETITIYQDAYTKRYIPRGPFGMGHAYLDPEAAARDYLRRHGFETVTLAEHPED